MLRGTSAAQVQSASGVTSINGLTGILSLISSDSSITITPSGVTIDLKANGTPGSGTVTSVSVVSANGVSASVATPTTTPALTFTLGNIVPSTIVASGNISGANLSGTNTGDQTNITGNAATATFASTAGTASAVAFSGITSATNTIAAMVVGNGASLSATGTGTITATSAPPGSLTTNTKTRSVGITIDGGGSVITTGNKGYIYVPYACTITANTLIADQSGSVVIDVWRATYPTVPTVANTITASALPTLSSQQVNQDTTLTGWTTSIAAGSFIGFNVNSATTVTRVNLTLTVTTT